MRISQIEHLLKEIASRNERIAMLLRAAARLSSAATWTWHVDLLPINQVEKVSTYTNVVEWSMTGDDPSFIMVWKPRRRLWATWHRLTIEFPNGWDALSVPQIYIDNGSGFNNRDRVDLQFVAAGGKRATALISLPNGAVSLRFDPSVAPGSIAIGKVSLRRLTHTAYYSGIAAKLARKRLSDPKQLAGSIFRAVKTLLNHGPGALARRLDAQVGVLDNKDYPYWIAQFDTLNLADKSIIARQIETLPQAPLIVIWSLRAEDNDHIQAAIASLSNQLHQNWQAVVIVTSTSHLKIAQKAAEHDPRIVVANTGSPLPLFRPEQALGATLLIVGKVLLREHALYMFALEASKGASFAYADEDILTANGDRTRPFFKPTYSPELAKNTPYFGSCVLVQPMTTQMLEAMKAVALSETDIVNAIENHLPKAFSKVVHIPFAVFGNHERPSDASLPNRVGALLSADLPTVTIIIPTRDHIDLLQPCIESILKKSEYPRDRYEIIVIDNGSSQDCTLRYLSEIETSRDAIILRDAGDFNYSRLNNRAAHMATSDILVFLNNDTVIEDPKWLQRLVFYARTPDIGVVGGKLLYPDYTVQHGGVVLGNQGLAGHSHRGVTDGGYENLCNLTHEVSAVTAACCAIRRSVFLEIGGFNEALAVAFNDVLLCLDALHHGYRNIYIGTTLVIHYESKSRGFDNTPEKQALFHKEATYARGKHKALFRDDPYYSPNLSLDTLYELAFPPRRPKPWREFERRTTRKLRILMLSVVHEQGHGVPVVLALQAKGLINAGHKVFIGGPAGRNEIAYDGCERLILQTGAQAADAAYKNDIDCVVSHTPPFFATVSLLGPQTKSIIYDYGEPPPELFPDADGRRGIQRNKEFYMPMADRVYAISNAVRDESGYPDMDVIPLGNSHLETWGHHCLDRRTKYRASKNWTEKFVVLNVCRFHKLERMYKGIDQYLSVRKDFAARYPDLASRVIFVQCGKGHPDDIRELETAGLVVLPNVNDEEMIDIYLAADMYLNFSRWEGYNLGIGQALAAGLPVVASDIPAHRAFGIPTTNDNAEVVELLRKQIEVLAADDAISRRRPVLWTWDAPVAQFVGIVENLCLPEVAAPDLSTTSSSNGSVHQPGEF
jgi:GT2 family glycosyltransferase